MIRQIFLAGALAGLIATPVLSAEAIEGTWLRPSTGTLVKFAPCGSAYCGTVLNGSYKGKSIGKLSGSGGNYKGKINRSGRRENLHWQSEGERQHHGPEGLRPRLLQKAKKWNRQ